MARRVTEQATWWENNRESPHKSLLNNRKLWQLIVRAHSKSGNQTTHTRLYNSWWCNEYCGWNICVGWVLNQTRKDVRSIVENIERESEESSRSVNQKLDKLCVTRWAIRAKCFKKILDNYEALLELWKQSLEENLDFDTKSRIKGALMQIWKSPHIFKFT